MIRITGGATIAQVDGGAGNDDIATTSGTKGTGSILGGDGNDLLVVQAVSGVISVGTGNDTVTGDLVVSGAGGLQITAGDGDDEVKLTMVIPGSVLPGSRVTVSGDAGNDTITADLDEAFVAVLFQFGTGWGSDEITGFADGTDFIRFVGTSGSGLDDFSDLGLSGGASETVISFGSDSITLLGVNLADFTADDVLFA